MNQNNQNFIKREHYLCGIGDYRTDKVETYKVGIYEGNGYFSFSCGVDGGYELGFHKSCGGNANCVLKVKAVDDIEFDNNDLIKL